MGRGRGRKSTRSIFYRFTVTLYGRDIENFCDLANRFNSNVDALKYLLAVEKQHTNWIRTKDRENCCDWYKVDEEECAEAEESLRQLPVSEATWNRYVRLSQLVCPSWAWKPHSQKIDVLLKMAERQYSSGSSHCGQAKSPVHESAKEEEQSEEHIRLSDRIPTTPQKEYVHVTDKEPPATPVKVRPQKTPSPYDETDELDLRIPKAEARRIDVRGDRPSEGGHLGALDSPFRAITSDQADAQLPVESDCQPPTSNQLTEPAKVSAWCVDQDHEQSGDATRNDPDENQPALTVRVPSDLQERYHRFFKFYDWDEECDETKVTILLDLAESHPSLVPPKLNFGAATAGNTSERLPREEIFQDESSDEPEEPSGQSSRSPPKKRAQNWPLSKVRRRTEVRSSSDDEDFSIDSDGTWDDGTQPRRKMRRIGPDEFSEEEETESSTEDDEGQNPGEEPDQADPKESNSTLIRLLKPDYFLKFSEQARNKRPLGSKRSLAGLANTRKSIVEKHQLKLLIAQCACSNKSCLEKIDKRSIKLSDIGWTTTVNAHCRGTAKHKFRWTASAVAPSEAHPSRKLYTLNITVPAALQISGNNFSKMEHFAKILRLTWGNERTNANFLQICRPVIHKCFEMTRHEMLETLTQEGQNGQIVLAGDGQFDSPGSCATVCTYTLMALGIDKNQKDGSSVLKQCGYVINQAVIDRRHADNKSTNMERVGLHWALQPILKAGLKVAELVTDDHVQIVSDFRKIAAAAEEENTNAANGGDEDTALTAFQESVATALLYYHPQVNVVAEVKALLSFYSAIIHSNDIWHRAKNLLKTVSTIAQSAPVKEQECYRRYAKMLRNYLWKCAEEAKGNKEKFLELWTAVRHHLQDSHTNCHIMDLHSKTKLMGNLDQATRPFARLIACIRRIEASAPQLCRFRIATEKWAQPLQQAVTFAISSTVPEYQRVRKVKFRNTGILESYNGLCLKYCPKRIYLTYDTMMMRRELAALDHNHHVGRAIKHRADGNAAVRKAYKKSTKAYTFRFEKEKKDYSYTGHLMAAILMGRFETETRLSQTRVQFSAAHPKRIQPNLVPEAERQTVQEKRSKWLSKQPSIKPRKTTKPATTKSKKKKQKRSSSTDSESEEWQSDGSESSDKKTKGKKRKQQWSDDEWQADIEQNALDGKTGETEDHTSYCMQDGEDMVSENQGLQERESPGIIAEAVHRPAATTKPKKVAKRKKVTKRKTTTRKKPKKVTKDQSMLELESSESEGLHILGVESDSG